MKTCPVCRAGAFDDAEVCYGCLHRFSQGDAQAFVAPSVASAPNSSESGGAVGVDVACEGQGGARSREPASMHAESVRQVVAADAGNVLSDCGSAMRSSLKRLMSPFEAPISWCASNWWMLGPLQRRPPIRTRMRLPLRHLNALFYDGEGGLP